jgi:FlaG/FlaF family flagellin (archaellin)
MDRKQSGKTIAIIVAVVIVLAVAYAVLTRPDHRTASQKIDDAMHAVNNGNSQDAVRQLEDRTPGQKLGDKFKDMTAPSGQ